MDYQAPAYATLARWPRGPWQNAAWISLLTLGLLYIFPALYLGVATMAFVLTLSNPRFGVLPAGSKEIMVALWVMPELIVVVSCAIFSGMAFLVRTGSRGAAIVSLVVVVLNVLVLVAVVSWWTFNLLRSGGHPIILLFPLLALAANVWVAVSLVKFLGESKRLAAA